jgi:hypothetical protein
LAGNEQCQFSITVSASRTGVWPITTSAPTATESGAGTPATASLTVAKAPTIAVAFADPTIPIGGTTRLTVTLANPNTTGIDGSQPVTLTGLAFSNTLPSGLVIGTPANVSDSCGGAVSGAAAGSSSFNLANGMLAGGATCTVSVDVTATSTGGKADSAGTVTSLEGGASQPSAAGTASVSVIGSPTVTVVTPAEGAIYDVGENVSATYVCADDPNAPGLASCVGTVPQGAALDTTHPGTFTFDVTATSADGQKTTQSVTYSVAFFRPQNRTRPTISGSARSGARLSCTPGEWSDAPTGFAYAWARNGTPIAGAHGSSYTVVRLDRGSTLTCTVTASNPAGAGGSATSRPVTVATGAAHDCPFASGRITATRIGPARLGRTPSEQRRALAKSSVRPTGKRDHFCFTPAGLTVGYASGRAVWLATTAPTFAFRGIRPGATLAAAQRRVRHGSLLTVGHTEWYLAPSGASVVAFGARHGLITQIAVADRARMTTTAAERTLLAAFG